MARPQKARLGPWPRPSGPPSTRSPARAASAPTALRGPRPCWRWPRADLSPRRRRPPARRSGDAVAQLVARFNTEGLTALEPRQGGGPPAVYDAATRDRILQEFRRARRPGAGRHRHLVADHGAAGAPRGAGRAARVSTKTILYTLWDAGYTWQQSRTWCQTGTVVRRRKAGPATVTDADATPKRADRAGVRARGAGRGGGLVPG